MATNDERSAAMEMMKLALSKPSLLTHGGVINLEKSDDRERDDNGRYASGGGSDYLSEEHENAAGVAASLGQQLAEMDRYPTGVTAEQYDKVKAEFKAAVAASAAAREKAASKINSKQSEEAKYNQGSAGSTKARQAALREMGSPRFSGRNK